jgi:hypothetical protein
MIYNSEAQFLISDLKSASEAEGVAIGNLLAAMKSGVKDREVLGALTDAMERTHSAKMAIFDQLQEFRLDK